jgi:hypothetical protein
MATTPLWVPLAVAGLAVLGTLAGVVFTQVWNSRLEERRWSRENDRLREAQAREDVNRTYEHRRVAYVDFLQEINRLERTYISYPQKPIRPPRSLTDPVYKSLVESYAAVELYGTVEADQIAVECMAMFAAGRLEDYYAAGVAYLNRIRKDLGIPKWNPAE